MPSGLFIPFEIKKFIEETFVYKSIFSTDDLVAREGFNEDDSLTEYKWELSNNLIAHYIHSKFDEDSNESFTSFELIGKNPEEIGLVKKMLEIKHKLLLNEKNRNN
jgi:hypothetical protein